jgi:hypothetical protein
MDDAADILKISSKSDKIVDNMALIFLDISPIEEQCSP